MLTEPSDLGAGGGLDRGDRESAMAEEHARWAVERAARAQPGWAGRPSRERAARCAAAAEILRTGRGAGGTPWRERFVGAIVDDVGKPRFEAEAEVEEAAAMLAHFARRGPRVLADRPLDLDTVLWPQKRSVLIREPWGVVAVIKPWNYPVELPLWSIGPALVAGNAVVFKPSQHAPASAAAIVELFEAARLPADVLTVLPGAGDTGAALAAAAGVDLVTFTGSGPAAAGVREVAARRGIPCLIEAGGKDALIVCHDAPLTRAAKGAVWGAFSNAGQACTSVERVFVHDDVREAFTARVLTETAALRLGGPCERDIDVAGLLNEAGVERVRAQVSDAVDRGAVLRYGGVVRRRGGRWLMVPTVLEDVDEDCALFTEETFGPVLALQRFNDYAGVVHRVNRSRYGLGASVWTRDRALADRLARRLDVGMVWINDVNLAFPQAPWGGRKASGTGQELSDEAYVGYTRPKHVCWDPGDADGQDWWFPYPGSTP